MAPELTPEQRQIVAHWGSGSAILAGAGSGKTTTLIEKCKKLIETKPDASIVAVSFTEKSAQDLRLRLGKLVSSEDLHYRHWITTIHGLCWKILRENPGPAGLDGEEIVLSELQTRQIWEEALERLWFGDLNSEIRQALSRLLERESRKSLEDLIARVVRLESFEVYDSILKSPDEDTRSLGIVARYVSFHYDNGKKRLGGVDFDDLEKGALKVLSLKKIREQYHRRFDLVLVDEFQDTNLVQSKIIWNFAKPDLSNLCVVGDPKQSIYRFRDADVELFKEKTSLLNERFELTWNFRSRPKIIEFVNRVCEPVFHASDMEYLSLHPMREPADDEKSPVLRLNIQEPVDLGRWIKQEVQNGKDLGQMAIVMRKIRGNEIWIKGLELAGISYVVGSGGLFWESPGVRELVCLLKWWKNPANELAGATFMRAPWVGVTDRQLDSWLAEGRNLLDSFLELDHPIARELSRIKGKTISPGDLILQVLVNQDVEDQIGQDALGLWHRAEELSAAGRNFIHVVRELDRAMSEGRRESLVPPPSEQGQLKIFTVHGSKGLEFEHLIVLDFKGKTRSAPAPLLFWDRKLGAFLGKRNASGDRDLKSEKQWRIIESSQSLSESKRLFYVALTRARESLTLVMNADAQAEGLDENCLSEDNWRDWILFTVPTIETLDFHLDLVDGQETQAKRSDVSVWHRQVFTNVPRKRTRHSATEWTKLRLCPLSYLWSFIDYPLENLSFEQNEHSAMNVGSEIHRAFEIRSVEILKEIQDHYGKDVLDAKVVARWMEESSLLSDDFEKVWKEWPFEVVSGSEILVGTIDRLILDGDLYRLIDFKYSKKKKSKKELWKSYQFQLDFYTFALSVLDSEISKGSKRVEQTIVNIFPSGVESDSVLVPKERIQEISDEMKKMGVVANRVINSKNVPSGKPGKHCAFCEFENFCPDALKPKDSNRPLDDPRQIDMFLTEMRECSSKLRPN